MHQDLNIARTHNVRALCTAVFTANISPHSLYLCSQIRPTALSHRIMNNTNQPYAQLTVCIKLRVPSTDHHANIHTVSGSKIICSVYAPHPGNRPYATAHMAIQTMSTMTISKGTQETRNNKQLNTYYLVTL